MTLVQSNSSIISLPTSVVKVVKIAKSQQLLLLMRQLSSPEMSVISHKFLVSSLKIG